jgi:dihydroorotate dehydrogenase (fumarate)
LALRRSATIAIARQLQDAGAGAIVMRSLFEEQIDAELLRLRWLAIVSPRARGSLAATGGVHTTSDVVKAIMAGADVVQFVSALLRHGPRFLYTLVNGLREWLDEHDYESVDQLRGVMSHRRCPDPAAFERANYIRILQTWRT